MVTVSSLLSALDLIKPLFIQPRAMIRRLYTSGESDEKIATLWHQFLAPKRKTVALICGTGGSSLPIASTVYLDFIAEIMVLKNYNIVLVGQVDLADPLSDYQGDNLLNCVNQTTVQDVLSILKKADYVVGGDTGPMHMASFLNKPLLYKFSCSHLV